MKTMQVLVLSVEEGRELLSSFYADSLSDSELALELLASGSLHASVPEVANLTEQQVAEMVGDLCLADHLKDKHQVDAVAIRQGQYCLDVVSGHDEMDAAEEPILAEVA